MVMNFDEKGKFFTEWVPTTAVRATIQTVNQLIRGSVHVRQGERLKDELNRDELFLAITDATVEASDGGDPMVSPFLAIRRSQIVWVSPDAEESRT